MMKKKMIQVLASRGYVILAISLMFIVTGYIIMSLGDRTISIILLVIAYVILIPLAILIPNKKSEQND